MPPNTGGTGQARRNSSKWLALPMRLQISARTETVGSKLAKPCASAATERAMPDASQTKPMLACSMRAISALEP